MLSDIPSSERTSSHMHMYALSLHSFDHSSMSMCGSTDILTTVSASHVARESSAEIRVVDQRGTYVISYAFTNEKSESEQRKRKLNSHTYELNTGKIRIGRRMGSVIGGVWLDWREGGWESLTEDLLMGDWWLV